VTLHSCTTFEHDEDWFVVALDLDTAALFHEEEETPILVSAPVERAGLRERVGRK
jgi:hypothetical protein